MGFSRWVSNIFGKGKDDSSHSHSHPHPHPHPHPHSQPQSNRTTNPHPTAGGEEEIATVHTASQTQERCGGAKVPEEGDDSDASSSKQQHRHQDQHRHPPPPHPQPPGRVVGDGGTHGVGGAHRRGFSMPVYMPVVDRSQLAPLLVECPLNNGGVQGLDWCGQLLLMDEDGDVAHEFYEEKVVAPPSPPPSSIKRGNGGSMTLASHIALEKQKQQHKKNCREGFIKVHGSTVRAANVRRVDLRDGKVRYLIQDSNRKCHWA